jgi:hypothetical protein
MLTASVEEQFDLYTLTIRYSVWIADSLLDSLLEESLTEPDP